MSSRFHAWVVTAAPNLISFGRWCRSAIDHRRQSQILVSTQSAGVVSLGSAGTKGGKEPKKGLNYDRKRLKTRKLDLNRKSVKSDESEAKRRF